MAENKSPDKTRIKSIVSLVCCIIIGITFVASGSGKAVGFGEIPGQTVEFIGDVLPEAWITPTTVFILFEVFVPLIMPAIELLLGIFLLVGFVPRLIAVICLPLTMALMGNNIWAIKQGLAQFPDCACFGIWETIFGGLTPAQALGYDILLFILAVAIILLYPGGFLSSRAWLIRLLRKETVKD
jgi:uncharacterized membrane protein YphA (DoxX/SURF4 family)